MNLQSGFTGLQADSGFDTKLQNVVTLLPVKRVSLILVLGIIAALLTGCGIMDPSSGHPAEPAATTEQTQAPAVSTEDLRSQLASACSIAGPKDNLGRGCALAGDGMSMEFVSDFPVTGTYKTALQNMNATLGFSDSTSSKMSMTDDSDGLQTESSADFSVSWKVKATNMSVIGGTYTVYAFVALYEVS